MQTGRWPKLKHAPSPDSYCCYCTNHPINPLAHLCHTRLHTTTPHSWCQFYQLSNEIIIVSVTCTHWLCATVWCRMRDKLSSSSLISLVFSVSSCPHRNPHVCTVCFHYTSTLTWLSNPPVMGRYTNTAADIKCFKITSTEQHTQYSLKKMQSEIFVLLKRGTNSCSLRHKSVEYLWSIYHLFPCEYIMGAQLYAPLLDTRP